MPQLNCCSRFLPAVIAVILAVFTSACTEDPIFPRQGLQIHAVALPPLSSGAHYQLWLSYPTEFAGGEIDSLGRFRPVYFSAGTFKVSESGGITSLDGGAVDLAIPAGYNPSLVGLALVTVEQDSDNDTIPGPVMLAGAFSTGGLPATAALIPGNRRAFGALFGGDSALPARRVGSFLLETPTSSREDDWMRGIWFVSRQPNPQTGDTLSPGLQIADQPVNADNRDWIYAAWLVDRTASPVRYHLLGRFVSAGTRDDDGAGPEAGHDAPGYAYPGQDFVENASIVDLRSSSYGVLITLQPKMFNVPQPLLTVLASDTIPTTATRSAPIPLTNPSDSPILEVTIVQ